MKNSIIIVSIIFLFLSGCKIPGNMENHQKYFLLQKNNGLQTTVSLINPYVYCSVNKDKVIKIKKELELKYLKNLPIDSHFDHHEINCDEEMINFDKFLLDEYGFSFLAEEFDHTQVELNNQILYGKLFPENLSDDQLLTIQNRMNKFHFNLIEIEPNNKSVIILNPWDLDNPLRDSEIFKLTQFFKSKPEAKKFIDSIIEEQFDLDGTYLIVGYITEDDITDETTKILLSQADIRYKSRREDYGEKFVAEKKLNKITNGKEILMQLLKSVDKTPYKIIELK